MQASTVKEPAKRYNDVRNQTCPGKICVRSPTALSSEELDHVIQTIKASCQSRGQSLDECESEAVNTAGYQ